MNFYTRLYCSDHPAIPKDLEAIIQPMISEDENEDRIRVPDEKEILTTLKMMNPEKAPGPDRMTLLFFRNFWEIVGADIVLMVQEFFTSDMLL